MNYYFDVWKNYAVFSGRATRTQYWMFAATNFFIYIIFGIFLAAFKDNILGTILTVLYWLYSIALIIPNLAVTVRRLHDTDRSGWWILIALIPLIGIIILIVFLATNTKSGPSRFDGSSGQPVMPPVPQQM